MKLAGRFEGVKFNKILSYFERKCFRYMSFGIGENILEFEFLGTARGVFLPLLGYVMAKRPFFVN